MHLRLRLALSLSLLAALPLAACDTSIGGRSDAGTTPREDAPRAERDASVDASVDTGVDAGPPPCATDETSALVFDGVDDGVSMGAAPELGLSRLTVEAWVRRDGEGRTGGTGVGGLSLVPIAGKGRGESDGTNVDCNYAFGFFGDVLGADFEDMAEGDNHPVIGRTTVSRGVWHHVAATYDGTTWRLYLDGAVDGEVATRATPRADSIQHFGLGTMLNSTGVAAGRLHGALDEVRVWDRARTASEIATSRFMTIASADNLVGRWALDEGDGASTAPDTAGGIDGTISGATFAGPGAPIDHGAPPSAVVVAPTLDSVVTGSSAELRVAVDGEPREVTFYVRALTEDDDFTIVVLPDTQYYTTGPTASRPDRATHFFGDQTRWVMENREAYRIAAVIHNGDIVDSGGNASQWRVAVGAMEILEEESADLPDGLPYGLAVGNHDESPNGTPNSTTLFNENFGLERFEGRSYYGGHYSTDNDENWITFSAGGLEFVVVSLQYDTTQDAAVTAWARNVFASHPDAFGVLNAHYILTGAGNFSAQGGAIYEALADVENVQLMTCGHVSAEARRSDTSGSGHTIVSMLADYQGRAQGGGGYMRVWEFSPMNDELTVRSYSPSADRWETDGNSEFTLQVDLSGAGGAFEEAEVVEFPSDDARASVPVEPGVLYEWYAVVRDCNHEVRTPTARFTVAAE